MISSDKTLHVVSFDVPYPANYGGVIDVFYKIKALHELGVNVILHSYQYGARAQQDILLKWCSQVHYYPRTTFMNPFVGKLPYIVKTRKSRQLLINLTEDDHPILFEGLHTCFWLNAEELKHRKRFVRNHNIEGDYYHHLARVETKTWKRQYFLREAKLLNAFEPILKVANGIAAISPSDYEVLNARYGNAFYLPVFHQNRIVHDDVKEKFCLYHGNLAVGENDEAACFLAEKVFPGLSHKLVIAGNQPSERLRGVAESAPNVEIMSGLGSEQILDLIRKAQVNVLPTFQSTGIKLKLLNALFNGGHCIVNQEMVEGTGLEGLCVVANDDAAFKQAIDQLMEEDYSTADKAKERVLADFDVLSSARLLLDHIW